MRTPAAIVLLILFASIWFFNGIRWGLPTSETNRFLFGDRPVWSGAEIIRLAGGWDTDTSVGADRDRNPITRSDQPRALNETDARRAEIVLRYRLFSAQPDEMITFRALSQIKPGSGKFDPKLYQYGGLWMYPVGALLQAASLIGYVHLTPDLAFYLDHPEAFARFYIVARLYSAVWGLIGVAVVFAIVRRLTGELWLGMAAGATFAMMPVVVCMAHEAKPHLAGAVLMLLAVRSAIYFADRGTRTAAILTGAICGAAVGMVPTSAPIVLILPVMVAFRTKHALTHVSLALLTLAAVYAVTNPFVVYNLFAHRELLFSNAGNTSEMYPVRAPLAGLLTTASLVVEGAGVVLAVGGVVGWLALHFSPLDVRKKLILLAVPAIALFIVLMLVAAGKPGEFGRFLIFPDIVLLIGTFVALNKLRPHWRQGAIIALCIGTASVGSWYLGGFWRDATGRGSRLQWASALAGERETEIALYAEPAPYSMPPVDLFTNRLVLLPKDHSPRDQKWVIQAVDVAGRRPAPEGYRLLPTSGSTTQISWADKPFEIYESQRKP